MAAWGQGGGKGAERRAAKKRREDFKKSEGRSEAAAKESMRKTGVGRKKPPKRKTYAAGSNIYDRGNKGKAQSYEEALKGGTRADDPRNWEFHYKEAGGRRMANRGGGKGGDGKRVDLGRIKAESMAKKTGKDVYGIKKLEWETANITQKTRQSAADRKAIGAGSTRSTRVAQGVAASRQMAARRRGGGGARGQSITSPRGNRRSIA